MDTKQIFRWAGICVAVAALVWIGIGAAIWSAYRTHRDAVAANAEAVAATTAAATTASIQIAPFDRTLSSVQYQWLAADADADQVPDWLARELDLPLNERSIGAWITFLRKENVAVCWRAAPRRAGEADHTFALPFERASVRAVLDELCQRDRRYRWEWMKGSQVVNVLADERLDDPLGDVSFRSRPFCFCLPDVQSQVHVWRDFDLEPPKGYGDPFYWPVAIQQAREITVRDYLNLAVKQYDGMNWTVDAQGILELDAPEATRGEVIEKYSSDTSP
jgi:hypothetical protein